MPVFEVFSHSDRFHYRANLFSLATCFLILCTILTFLPPFLFTYFAGGYWMKEGSYSEQPRVNYSSKYILITDSSSASSPSFSSSYATLNAAFRDVLIATTNTFIESDSNFDGINDKFSIVVQLLFGDSTIVINNINLWLIFQFQLRARQYISMETMALININTPSLSLSNNPIVTTEGELIFKQRQPIQSSGSDTIYSGSIINSNVLLATSPINLNPVLDEYFTRKYYTTYQSQSLKLGNSVTSRSSSILTLNITVNVGRQSIRFIPGFWQEFKWGWIQYVSVLLPFIIVFNRIKEFVFRNQLVRTLVEVPYHQSKTK